MECVVLWLDQLNLSPVNVLGYLLLKPLDVIYEPGDCNWTSDMVSACRRIGFEGELACGRSDMGSFPGGTQAHALRHVLFTKLQEFAKKWELETGQLPQMRCRGKSVGSCSDDT